MRKFDRVLLTAWMLNVYDAGITVYATQAMAAEELNPLMRAFLDSNPVVFIIFKLLVMTLVCSILRRRFEFYPKRAWATAIIIAVLYAAACMWNTYSVLVALG
jgi:hypothetical protein